MASHNDKPDDTKDTAPENTSITGSAFIRQQPGSMSVEDVVAKGKAEGIKVSPNLVRIVRRNAEKKRAVGSEKPSTGKKAGPVNKTSAKHSSTKPAPSAAEKVAALKKSLSARKTAPANKKSAVGAPRPTSWPRTTPAPKTGPAKAYTGTKRAFVLEHSKGTPAADIVEAARLVGLELTVDQIHSIRSKAKSSRRKAKGHAAAAGTTASTSKAASSPTPVGTVTRKTASPPAKAAQSGGDHDTEQDDHEAFFAHVLRIGLTRAERLLATVKDKMAELTHRRL